METGLNGAPAIGTVAGGASAATSTQELIMVSNRGPLEHYVDGDGRMQQRRTAGGVATALASLQTDTPLTWISNATSEADKQVAAQGHSINIGGSKRLRQVSSSAQAYELFYGTICNPVLWFLQHSLWNRLERAPSERELQEAWVQGYLAVNQTFAEAVVQELDRGQQRGRVLFHDYHLYAAPLIVRNLRPNALLQHFIHIPWPEPSAWQELPRSIVISICEGLLANDSVVFQTERCVKNFMRTCEAFLSGIAVDRSGGTVMHGGRCTRIWWNPVSVDIWDLRSLLASPRAEAYRAKLGAALNERTIVRVDRLDASKNVAAGFRAYGRLLESHPEWAGKVTFLAFLVPSRTTVPEYQAYADEVFAEVAAVNARYGTSDWTPIKVFHEQNRTQALVALSLYDVLLVNPIIDGMNLVSKEGPVLNERDGVLVLSTEAGSFAELSSGALPVDPDDVQGTADALHTALSMSGSERRERSRHLREAVIRHDLSRWLHLLLEDPLEEAPLAAGAGDEAARATRDRLLEQTPTTSSRAANQ